MYSRANEVRTGGAQTRCGQPAINSTSDAQPDSGQHAPWTLPFATAPDLPSTASRSGLPRGQQCMLVPGRSRLTPPSTAFEGSAMPLEVSTRQIRVHVRESLWCR